MNSLRYNKPAKMWIGCLPLGNGKIGAMINGGITHEKIYINDDTLWSGYPKDDRTDFTKTIAKARKLLDEDNPYEASHVMQSESIGDWSESYLPLGVIDVKYKLCPFVTHYERSLNLNSAIHISRFSQNKAQHKRESFVSNIDKIGVYKAESDTTFNAKVTLSSLLPSKLSVDKGLSLTGKAPDKVLPNYLMGEKHPISFDEGKGMAFALRLKVRTDGIVVYGKDYLAIKNCHVLELYYTTATGFNGYDKQPITDEKVVLAGTKRILDSIIDDYDSIKLRHVKDFEKLYNRVKLSLGEERNDYTSKLVKMAKRGNVANALMELFYNYGRYLMISGSREGSRALNLQGIWNNKLRPAWSSNYTTNINTQMNYWGMRGMNTDECYIPYINFMEEVRESGTKTASKCFKSRGFTANHNIDIWAKTTPVKGPSSWAYFPLAGVWLTNELYDMYRYNQDLDYLNRIAPIVKDSVLFALDYLVLQNGRYITYPSTSPEICYYKDGKCCTVGKSSAFDISAISALFKNYLEMQSKLDDIELVSQVQNVLSKLGDVHYDSEGAITEWADDVEIREVGHRHFSPLYSVFPAFDKLYYRDNEYIKSARKLLDRRIEEGSGQTGWSASWAINLYARMHDGEMAGKMFEKQLQKSITKNLFDLHPIFIFQIDGNLGTVQGIHEMLLQAEDGVVELLPALPRRFNNGSIKGLRTVGNVIIDMEWRDGLVTKLNVSGKQIKLLNKNLSKNLVLDDKIELVL